MAHSKMDTRNEPFEAENDPPNNCIGNLEHHVHKVFALVRVPGEDFVYSPSMDLFNYLDNYCDEQTMHESRPPLLIKGESGTGKSALLSNWLQRRERITMRSRSMVDEFIFWHAVGCSRQSMNVNFLIRRLIVELKARFELGRSLPKSQERFSWELPRFLDLASKRGKIIIVIDGLNRLVNNENVEDALAWLPLEFPPNVRVILSVTIPTKPAPKQEKTSSTTTGASTNISGAVTPSYTASRPASGGSRAHNHAPFGEQLQINFDELDFSDEEGENTETDREENDEYGNQRPASHKGKRSRILQELERRQIPYFLMKPLDKQLCRSLVEAFIHKSVNSETAALATGPYIQSYLTVNAAASRAGASRVIVGGKDGSSSSSSADGGQQQQQQQQPRHSQVVLGVAENKKSSKMTEVSETVPGFLLFENQITALLNHSQGGTPLFLRLFLRCLHYAVSRGYSLWEVYEDWMQANSVPELLIRILGTLEGDFERTRESAQVDTDKTISAGGLPALKAIYDWHPFFQATLQKERHPHGSHHQQQHYNSSSSGAAAVAAVGRGDGLGNIYRQDDNNLDAAPTAEVAGGKRSRSAGASSGGAGGGTASDAGNLPEGTIPVIPMRHRRPPATQSGNETNDKNALASIAAQASDMKGGKVKPEQHKLSVEVRQNLGDQAWIHAEKAADVKLQEAIKETTKNITDAVGAAKVVAQEHRHMSMINALVGNLKFAMADSHAHDMERGIIREVDEFGFAVRAPPKKIHTTGGDSLSGATANVHGLGDDFTDSGDESDSDDDDENSLVSLEDRSVMSDHTTHSKTIRMTQEIIPAAMRPSSLPGDAAAGAGPAAAAQAPSSALTSGTTSPYLTRINSVSSANAHTAAAAAASHTSVDPSEGLQLLPVYLRGGVSTTGFGNLLGNALALLYVSRQGLRESELWKILSLLHHKSQQETRFNREVRAQNHMVVRVVASAFIENRGPLVDKFKADDINHTGYITRKQMLISARKHHPELTMTNLLRMLDFVNSHAPPVVAVSQTNQSNTLMHYYQDRDLIVGNHVHYNKLYMLLVKQNKVFKFTEKLKPGKSPLIATSSAKNLLSEKVTGGTGAAKSPKKGKGKGGGGGKVSATEQALAGGAASDDDFDNFQLNPQVCDPQQANIKRWHTRSGDPEDDVGEALFTSSSPKRPGSAESDMGFDGFNAVGRSGKTQNTAATTGTAGTNVSRANDGDDDDEDYSLGAVIEESLISILSALGVLHDPENKVLILPSDSEPFRQVIYNNYILKRNGGSLLSWHHLLVQHFQTEPNSLRKCEELPWHLKICRKWHTLRDTLVDLRAFDLMARHDLKDELHEYWLLLTEGPLLLPESSTAAGDDAHNQNSSARADRPSSASGGGRAGHSGGNKKRSDDDSILGAESTHTHVLRELDQAAELGVTVRDIRRKNAKYQIQPFDIVEELNKSLETWVTTDRPGTRAIHRTVLQIARFLFDFAYYCKPAPDFLRLGVDLESVMLFGGGLADDIRSFAQTTAPPDRKIGGRIGVSDGAADDAGDAVGDGSGTSLAKNSGGGDDGGGVTRFFDTKKTKEARKFPTPDMKNSNLYCYERWVWIQFPWLALFTAGPVAIKLRALRLEEEKARREKSITDPSLLSRYGGGGGGGAAAADGYQDDLLSKSEQSFMSSKDNERLLRVWNVKKSDPTVPVYHNSVNRRLAAIKPRTSLSSTLERNVEVTFNNLYEEITSPSHIYKVRMGVQKRDKFRRSFEEEESFNKSIPHSAHSIRSVKHGTLFPTYEADLKALKRKQLDDMLENRNLERRRSGKPPKKFDIDAALSQPTTSKSGPSNPFFMTELDDEIRHISNEEYIDHNRINRTGAAVITDEVGLEYEANLDRIARMKTIRNKLSQIYKEKSRTLNKMEIEINHRNESDQALIDEVLNSEVLLRSLHQRNIGMERSLEEAKQLEEGFTELIVLLKNNPPYMEAHVKSLEIEVQLAEKQFEEMVAHRNALYHEHERQDAIKRVDFKEQIQYFAQARADVAVRKRQVRREINYLRDPNAQHNEMNRRNTKGGIHGGGHHNLGKDPDSPNGSQDSYDSDDSSEAPAHKPVALTAPVKHFLNAMVRKISYMDTIVKDSDKTLEDVKQRSIERNSTDEAEAADVKFHALMAARRASKKPAKKADNIIIPSTAFLSPAEVAAQLHHETDLNSVDSSGGGGSGNNSSIGLKAGKGGAHGGGGGGASGAAMPGGAGKDSHSVGSKGENSSIMSKGSTLPFGSGLTSAEYMNYASITKHMGRAGGPAGAAAGSAISGPNSPTHTTGKGISFGAAMYAGATPIGTPAPKRKLSTDELHRLKQTIRLFQARSGTSLSVAAGEDGKPFPAGSKELLRAQVIKVVQSLLHRTESATVDEFVTRYEEGQKLATKLAADQVKLDSRLTQLRGEHAELLSQLNDMSFLVPAGDKKSGQAASADVGGDAAATGRGADVGGSGIKKSKSGELDDENAGLDAGLIITNATNTNTATAASLPPTTVDAAEDTADNSGENIDDEFANTDRYLDNKLFNAEVRMNQFVRLYDSAVVTISEVRTAVGHLVNLMDINAGLLQALPRSEPPALNSSDAIMSSLQWFEDRVMQLGEALTMDANRPTGSNVTDDSKPLSERQIDLAMLIHEMQKSQYHRKLRLSHHQKGAAKKQAMSKGLIASGNDGDGGAPFISPSSAVKVLSSAKIDKVYDQKMKEIFAEREKREEFEALNTKIAESSQHQSDIQRFLSDGIDHKVSKDMSRVANRLVDKNQGRHATYGLVLESMLASKGHTFQPIATSVLNNKNEHQNDGVGGGLGSERQKDGRNGMDGGGLNTHSIASVPTAISTAASSSVFSSPSRCEPVD